jgi:O-antigen/teichoic acid export membrane protein
MLSAFLAKFDVRDMRWLTAAATFAISRGINFLLLLVTVPLALGYLGVDRFGLWMAASSIIALFIVLEAGIGVGLVMSVPNAVGSNDQQSVCRQFSSAIFTLSTVGCTLVVAAVVGGYTIEWPSIFRIPESIPHSEVAALMAWLGVCLSLNFPVSFLRHFRLGLQEGAQAGIWELAASGASFAGILLAVLLDWGLVGLAIGAAGAPALVRIVHMAYFLWDRPEYRPSKALVSLHSIRDLLNAGVPLWIIGTSNMLALQASIWLLGIMAELSDVAEYSVAQRYFVIAFVPATILFGTLLPALSEAVTKGDFAWVRNRFIRTTGLTIIIGIPALILMALAADTLLPLWVGDSIEVSRVLNLTMAAYYVLMLVQTACSTAQLALKMIKIQIVLCLSTITASIFFCWILIPFYGAVGAALGLLLASAFCLVIPQLYITIRALKNMHRHLEN